MIPQPFRTLWKNPTFANLIRTLPTVLTSSLFMLFGLLEMVLACLNWVLFVLIITATFLFGLGLLMGFMLVLVGLLMGSGKEEDGEVRWDVEEDAHAERKVEQEEVVLDSDTEEKTRENAEQDVHVEHKVKQEEADLDSDTEEKATHSPSKSAVLDTAGVEETENGLDEYWTKPSEETGEDYERDALQRISKRAHEELVADIRSSSLSPERGTSE